MTNANSRMLFNFITCGFMLAITGVLSGCIESGIEVHTVPKSEQVDLPEGKPITEPETGGGETYRMLAALIPAGGQVWSYKITGPGDVLQKQYPAFLKFLEDLKYSGGEPTWTLPEGWKNSPEKNQFRYATIKVPTEGKELTLKIGTIAPRPDWDQYTLENVNRWRGQLGIAPIELNTMLTADVDAGGLKILKIDPSGDNLEARIINAEGPKNPDAGGMAPFMQGR